MSLGFKLQKRKKKLQKHGNCKKHGKTWKTLQLMKHRAAVFS